jgi:hypothetical protein
VGLLKKAENEMAFLKAGLLGFPGSGKSYTASMLAQAISKRVGSGRPVAFFDTESGSDFLIPKFEAAGVELLRVKSKAFSDLLAVGKEAEAECAVLIVDSISHVWNELGEAYLARLNSTRKDKGWALLKKLEFQHWASIKREWAQWTSFYLNSRLHIIVCGRAGYEYEFVTNDETNKKELQKAGTKMRVESEFGFEPSLLMEMERVARGPEPGDGWLHRVHILKDRTDSINGKAFDFVKPGEGDKRAAVAVAEWERVFTPFAPVFASLNIGGAHKAVDDTRNSEARFSNEGESRGDQWSKRRTIAAEEVQGILVDLWPGQDAASKKFKSQVINELFRTFSWTAVENKPVEELEEAVGILRLFSQAVRAQNEMPADAPAALALLMMARGHYLDSRAAVDHLKALTEPVTDDEAAEREPVGAGQPF